MPVEIREIIIKTEITVRDQQDSHAMKNKDFNALKKQLLNECRRLIAEVNRKKDYKR